jgi:hypothetical protein
MHTACRPGFLLAFPSVSTRHYGQTAMIEDASKLGVDVFDSLFVEDDNMEFVEAADLAQLDESERQRVSNAVAPFEESRRSAKLRGDLRLYG